MKIHKAERPRVEEVLATEGDMDEVVAAVFERCIDLALEREWYVAVMRIDGQSYVYGPYETQTVAKRETNRIVSPGPGPAEIQIRRMYRVRE